MDCMTFDEVGVKGGCLFVGALSTHHMSGSSLARHVHGIVGHVHWSIHYGNVLSCDLEYWLFAFMSV
jgi:hypothetical protein